MTTLPTTRSRTRFASPEERAGYAAGLRLLATLIEHDPTVPIPSGPEMSLFIHGSDSKEKARELLRKLGRGQWSKKEFGQSLIFEGWAAGLPVDIWVDRDAVCERVVVGTREITEEVPVGEDTRPTETVTRTEEIVKWVCSPLLADETAEVSA